MTAIRALREDTREPINVIADSTGALKTTGTSTFTPPTAATGTKSNVTSAAADTIILAANANRRGGTIYNDSTAALYLSLGTTAASTTSFTVVLAGNGSGIGGFYELPSGFTGQVRGIWASANGFARVTELTA